ncbi:MAG: alpha-mannosidase, partial [Bacilli bacterium]|nr:alpha-mannosidase [Bacilli bacterium]
MFFTEEKIEERIKELSSYRYRDTISIRDFHMIADPEGRNGAYPPNSGEGSIVRIGDSWKGTDLYHWLITTVEIPADWARRKIVGMFDFAMNNSFESLLFVNRHPYQGVDSNHQEVFFSPKSIGQTVDLRFRIWTRLGGQRGYRSVQENKLKMANLSWLDEAVDDLYYTATVALETLKVLETNRPERWILLNALDKAIAQLDWSKPGSERFYESVNLANDLLNSELQSMEKQHPVTVQCIGHTHIDVAWLWRLKHTREKSARSFSTVLRLMELFPEYVFLQTQPQLYDYIKSDYPEIYAQIKEKVLEGRWEAEGGMWLEADCN